MEPGPLEEYTVNDLVQELARRYDALIVAGVSLGSRSDDEVMVINGSPVMLVGMAELVRRRIAKNAADNYRPKTGDGQ